MMTMMMLMMLMMLMVMLMTFDDGDDDDDDDDDDDLHPPGTLRWHVSTSRFCTTRFAHGLQSVFTPVFHPDSYRCLTLPVRTISMNS